jgi:hypothetical protein
MLVQKPLKPCGKNWRNPQHKNVIIIPMKNPFEKIKKQTLSYIDIASLKHIVRKLFKAKLA